MLKQLLLGSFLFYAGFAYAQDDLDVSLFFEEEEEEPLLGRSAEPLESIRVTPPPAPNLRINLSNEEPSLPPPPEPSQPMPQIPSTHIDLSGTTPAPIETAIPPKSPEVPLRDVSDFEIAGFNLGESASAILKQALQRGFRTTLTQERVPMFYSTTYHYQCQKMGVITPDNLAKCIKDLACQENTRYISEAVLTRKNETIHLYFTSNATDNALYKIVYVNKGDASLNSTRFNVMKKKLRQTEFWNAVFDKYGYPDDEAEYVWGNPAKGYMKASMSGSAYDGTLILEDVKLANEDYFAAADAEDERSPRNTFGF